MLIKKKHILILMFMLMALIFSLSLTTAPWADNGDINAIVQQKCAEVKNAGSGGMERFENWILPRFTKISTSLQSTRDRVIGLNKKWERTIAELAEKQAEIKTTFALYESQAITRAEKYNEYQSIALEILELKRDLKKNSDKAKEQLLTKQINELEVKGNRLAENLLKNKQDYSAIWGYFEIEEFNLLNTGALDKVLRNIQLKRDQLQKATKDLGNRKANLEKDILMAWDDYQEARILLKTLKKIYQEVERCAATETKAPVISVKESPDPAKSRDDNTAATLQPPDSQDDAATALLNPNGKLSQERIRALEEQFQTRGARGGVAGNAGGKSARSNEPVAVKKRPDGPRTIYSNETITLDVVGYFGEDLVARNITHEMTWRVETGDGTSISIPGPVFNAGRFGPGDYWVIGTFGDYTAEFKVYVIPSSLSKVYSE